MGVGAALVGIGLGLYSANKQAKAIESAQSSAAAAAEQQAKMAQTATASTEAPDITTSESTQFAETNAQNKAKRRASIASTAYSGGLLGSLTGGRQTLG